MNFVQVHELQRCEPPPQRREQEMMGDQAIFSHHRRTQSRTVPQRIERRATCE